MSDELMKAAGTTTMRIKACASCGGDHEDVQVLALATPQRPYTHWFRCPKTGDPVPMALLMIDDQTALPVHSAILQAIVRCLTSRRYLLAFWRVENGVLYCDDPLYADFPAGDFGPAIGHLYETLCKKTGQRPLGVPAETGLAENKPGDTPLPVAEAPLPKVRIFGEEGVT